MTFKTTGFRDWKEANDTIRLLRKIIDDTDTENDQRVQAQTVLNEMLKDNEDDCIRCGAHYLEMAIHHTLALSEPGKVLTFCPICIDHVLKGIHPLGPLNVVKDTMCVDCGRDVPVDDRNTLPGGILVCLSCLDKRKGESDDT